MYNNASQTTEDYMGIQVNSVTSSYPVSGSLSSDPRILSLRQLPETIAGKICTDLTTVEMKKTPFEGVFAGVFFGNPKSEGLSGQIVFFPKNYVFPSHEHPKEGYTTVISGIIRVYFGAQKDNNYIDLHPGESALIPANEIHNTEALTDVTIQVTGYGPSETHFV